MTFLLKAPVGLLAAIATSCVWILLRWRTFFDHQNLQRRPYLIVIALGTLIYWVLSMSSNLTIGIRHLLPAYLGMILLSAVVISAMIQHKPLFVKLAAACVLMVTLAWEAFASFPDYIGFFNVFTQGPRQKLERLADSNLDYGQDLKKLAIWAKEHNAEPICVAYAGTARVAYYGFEFINIKPDVLAERPTWREDCRYYAISATFLIGEYGADDHYQWLWNYPVKAVIGSSIWVFEVDNRLGSN